MSNQKEGSAVRQAREYAVRSAVWHLERQRDIAIELGERSTRVKLLLMVAVTRAIEMMRRGRVEEARILLEVKLKEAVDLEALEEANHAAENL